MTGELIPGGRLTVELCGRDGRVLRRDPVDNLITVAGRSCLALLLGGQTQVKGLRMAVGTDATDPTPEDTALGAMVDTVAADLGEPRRMVDNGRQAVGAVVRATLPPLAGTSAQALREAGIMIDTGVQSVLYNHVVFPVITRTADLQVSLSWEVIF